MFFAALSVAEIVAILLAAAPVVGVLFAGANVLVSVFNERKRSQPIVVCNETHKRHFREGGRPGLAVGAYIKNEGTGPAFNVRFGVELNGIKYPYKLYPEDPDTGNVQRVLAPGEARPGGTAFEVVIPDFHVWVGKGDPDPGRVYWARYENAQGKTWETRNPGDRSARLDIHQVRWVGRVESGEENARQRIRSESIEAEKHFRMVRAGTRSAPSDAWAWRS
jgi:hypothetical protein